MDQLATKAFNKDHDNIYRGWVVEKKGSAGKSNGQAKRIFPEGTSRWPRGSCLTSTATTLERIIRIYPRTSGIIPSLAEPPDSIYLGERRKLSNSTRWVGMSWLAGFFSGMLDDCSFFLAICILAITQPVATIPRKRNINPVMTLFESEALPNISQESIEWQIWFSEEQPIDGFWGFQIVKL